MLLYFRWICFLFFCLPLCGAFAGAKSQEPAGLPEKKFLSGKPAAAEQAPGQLSEINQAQDRPTQDRAETVLRAFAAAYPDRIGEIEFLDGDWTIQVYGERFYFSEGRLLPASLLDKMNEYNPHPFYNYTKELPPWREASDEESARMKEQDARRQERPSKRSTHFYDALWRTRSRDEAWEHIKQIRFLGYTIQVHYSVLVDLSLVEEQILRAAKTNAAVRQWVSNINNVESWNWRNIAASESRSYHAYGAAIDILPKSLGGLATYWLWTARTTPEWWNVPYTKRFHPPDEVIGIFESFGFVWGGKWRYYDTMHFEYRPEILVLSGIARKDKRELR